MFNHGVSSESLPQSGRDLGRGINSADSVTKFLETHVVKTLDYLLILSSLSSS